MNDKYHAWAKEGLTSDEYATLSDEFGQNVQLTQFICEDGDDIYFLCYYVLTFKIGQLDCMFVISKSWNEIDGIASAKITGSYYAIAYI
jgi:hypothetical protein